MQHYNCKEWVPPPNTNAPEPDAPELHENARPLSLPPLNLIASLRVRLDVENGDADAHPSLPLQCRVTKQIMREWDRHKLALSNLPTDRMRDVHKLHITQSVPMLDENSAIRPNMPQRDDDEGGKPNRLSLSPASSVWGQMGSLGLQSIEMLAQLSSSHRLIMLLSSISSSGSPTIQHSLLSQMCHADARGTLWVGRAYGITSIHVVLILPIGLERTITS
jgi:hypothetical protein